MKKLITLFLFSLGLIATMNAQNLTLDWAISAGQGASNVTDAGIDVVSDDDGNVITVGFFDQTVDFDPSIAGVANITSSGSHDIYIQKLDEDGNYLWAKSIGNSSAINLVSSVDVDDNGNIYLTGHFDGTLDFDPDPQNTYVLTSGSFNESFILKLDAAGNFAWVRHIAGTDPNKTSQSNAIAVDDMGNSYTTGYFNATFDFDPGPGSHFLTPRTSSDSYVLKLDNAGDFVWARTIEGLNYAGSSSGHDITLYDDTNVYVTGSFSGIVDANPDVNSSFTLTSNGSKDIYIQKLTDSGNFVWARGMGGTSLDQGFSIAVDNNENVYSCGYFFGTANFNPGNGNQTLTSSGDRDGYVLKMDRLGNFQWVRQIGGANKQECLSIAVSNSGVSYTTGYFQSATSFGTVSAGRTLVSAGRNDAFIQEMDAAGNLMETYQMGSTMSERGSGVHVDEDSYVYLTGDFQLTVDFDPGAGIFNLSSLGGIDAYTLKMLDCNALPAPDITDQVFCQTIPAAIGSDNPFPGADVYWSYINSQGRPTTVGPADPVSSNLLDLTFTGQRTYQVYNQVGSCVSSVTSFTITIPMSPPVMPQASDIVLCAGSVATPVFNVTSSPGNSFAQYELYADAALTNLVTSASTNSIPVPAAAITNANPQFFWLVERTTDGCVSAPIQLQISYSPVPSGPVIALGTTLCENYLPSTSVITVSSSLISGGRFVVLDNNNNVIATSADGTIEIPGLVAGTYVYTVHEELNGCRGPGTTVSVTVFSSTGQFPEHILDPNNLSNTMKVTSIAEDKNDGSMYVTGWFTRDIEIRDTDQSGTNVTTMTGLTETIFIAKYDLCGVLVWLQAYGQNGETGATMANDMVVGPHGNIYLTGQYEGKYVDFSSTANPGSQPRFSSSGLGPDAFVMKVEPQNGRTIWSISTYSKGNIGSGITFDNQNVYIIGRALASGFNLNQFFINTHPHEDYYVASISQTNGTANWIELSGLTGNVSTGGIHESIGIDQSGTLYISGSYSGQIDFGSLNQISSLGGLEDIFLGTLDNTGNALSIKNIGAGQSNDLVGDMAIAPNGDVYLTGSFTNTTDLGGGPVTASAGEEAFIAKYDNNGRYLWHQATRGVPAASVKGVGAALDIADDVYITGYFTGATLDFHGITSINTIANNLFGFTAGYTSNGNFKFAQLPTAGTTTSSCEPVDIVTRDNGVSYYAGEFIGKILFQNTGTGNLRAANTHGFIAKIDHTGTMSSRPELGTLESDDRPQISKFDPKLYPNPAKDYLEVSVDLDGNHRIAFRLFDLSGRYISGTEELVRGKYHTKVNLSELPDGLYIIELEIDQRIIRRKFLIEK